jgi:putative membrane protein (TIGR04086 family)
MKGTVLIMSPVDKTGSVRPAIPVMNGLLFAFIVTIIGTFATSLLLSFTQMNESSLPIFSVVNHGLSTFVGGFMCGKRAGRKGWYYGGILGASYFALVIIIAFLAVNQGFGTQTLSLLGLTLAASSIGGIIGVNAGK